MSMGWDTVTVWRADAAAWSRVVATGVRVENSRQSSEASVGPTAAGELKVYFFRDPGIRPGDYVAVGAVDGEEPPSGARVVTKVAPWTLRHRYHHTEVSCV